MAGVFITPPRHFVSHVMHPPPKYCHDVAPVKTKQARRLLKNWQLGKYLSAFKEVLESNLLWATSDCQLRTECQFVMSLCKIVTLIGEKNTAQTLKNAAQKTTNTTQHKNNTKTTKKHQLHEISFRNPPPPLFCWKTERKFPSFFCENFSSCNYILLYFIAFDVKLQPQLMYFDQILGTCWCQNYALFAKNVQKTTKIRQKLVSRGKRGQNVEAVEVEQKKTLQ